MLRPLHPAILLCQRSKRLQTTSTGGRVLPHTDFSVVSLTSLRSCPPQNTLKELQAFVSDSKESSAANRPPEDPPSKRAKLELSAAPVQQADEDPRVCVACLGVLQELCDSTQAVKVWPERFAATSHCAAVDLSLFGFRRSPRQ